MPSIGPVFFQIRDVNIVNTENIRYFGNGSVATRQSMFSKVGDIEFRGNFKIGNKIFNKILH